MIKKITATIFFFLFSQNLILAQTAAGQCESTIHNLRTKEIQEIVQADQDDRKIIPLPADVIARDQKRRIVT